MQTLVAMTVVAVDPQAECRQRVEGVQDSTRYYGSENSRKLFPGRGDEGYEISFVVHEVHS